MTLESNTIRAVLGTLRGRKANAMKITIAIRFTANGPTVEVTVVPP
jgi:hypothetical protein